MAGNIFDRVCAQGIDVHGAKQNRAATDRPFTRILIHHNKAVDTLLNVDDFGGIETWQGGPAYVYNNISGNPGGYRNWDHVLSPDTEDRFGHAYYLDGAFKNYYFNNIAWGKSKGPSGKLANTSAFQEIISYENTFFNNTLYNFVRGSRRQAPQAGRVKFLGNIWQSMGLRVFRDADPARTAAAGNEADAGPRRNRVRDRHQCLRAQRLLRCGGELRRVRALRAVAQDARSRSRKPWKATSRWPRPWASWPSSRPCAIRPLTISGRPPTRRPAAWARRSSCRGASTKRSANGTSTPIPGDPTRIMDEHWCMSPYYTGRDDYYKFPTYPLQGVNITLEDYQERSAGELDHGRPALQRARPVRRPHQRRHQPHGHHGGRGIRAPHRQRRRS